MIKMKFWSTILLLGVGFVHWTTAESLIRNDCVRINIEYKTLQGVNPIVTCNDIDLSYLELTRTSVHVFDHLTNMKTLNLSNNNLYLMQKNVFEKLENLEELSLANNNLYSINYDFKGLKNLKRLNISNNPIDSLYAGVSFGLPKSTEIITEKTGLSRISPGMFHNPVLAESRFRNLCPAASWTPNKLSIDNTSLSRGFKVKLCVGLFGYVSSVEELKENETLSDCKEVERDPVSSFLTFPHHNFEFERFQLGWYKLPQDSIRALSLARQQISDITPQLLNDLPSGLIYVNLDSNSIDIIKKNAINNRNIKILSFVSNYISTIEDGALQNNDLTGFFVDSNSLNSLVFVRTLPTSLIELGLSSNLIPDIPANTFRGFKNLRYLTLARNRLEKLESGIFEDQENLVELHLDNNRISQLNSGSFNGLKKLEYLKLWNNEIKKISHDSFSVLKNRQNLILWNLDLSQNKIDTIEGGSFSNMNIHELDLGGNRITAESIAKDSFSVSTICHLSLSQNLITKITDESLDSSVKIYELRLSGNQLVSINITESLKNVKELVVSGDSLKRLINGASWAFSTSTPDFVGF